MCTVSQLSLREGYSYQIDWVFGNSSNRSLSPPPLFLGIKSSRIPMSLVALSFNKELLAHPGSDRGFTAQRNLVQESFAKPELGVSISTENFFALLTVFALSLSVRKLAPSHDGTTPDGPLCKWLVCIFSTVNALIHILSALNIIQTLHHHHHLYKRSIR